MLSMGIKHSDKKVIAFDLDGTLTPSKSPMLPEMAQVLAKLLAKYEILVIGGGDLPQFQTQFINSLPNKIDLSRLHLMPTSGTKYYRHEGSEWKKIYSEDLDVDQVKKITDALNEACKKLGFKEDNTQGPPIENRGTQVTISPLGQQAILELKERWDPDGSKKKALRDLTAAMLPDYEVRTGGLTSVDVTKKGINKAYGIKKIQKILNIKPDEILFFGDAVYPGGNDFEVKQAGIDTVQVKDWLDTRDKLLPLID